MFETTFLTSHCLSRYSCSDRRVIPHSAIAVSITGITARADWSEIFEGSVATNFAILFAILAVGATKLPELSFWRRLGR